MKRMTFLTMAAVLTLAAAPKLDSDREALLRHLEGSSMKVRDATKGLSEAQWSFKAAPDRWSIAECLEHITASESFILDLARKSLESPPTPEKKAGRIANDARILKMLPDRTQKFKAPEPLQPAAKFGSPADTLGQFQKARKTTIEFVRNAAGNFRDHASPHPAFQEADTHQWVLFLSGHTERHVLQMLEVKADPAFPKH